MPHKVCVECRRALRPFKNGVRLELLAEDGSPYQLFQADIWECPDCLTQTAFTATLPIAEHFHTEYAELARTALLRFS